MNACAVASQRGRAAANGSLPRILPMEAEVPLRPRAGRTSRRAAPGAARSLAADLCYIGLRMSGWLAVTLLATSGLYVVFFMALGNMSADGFFAQLANLANRFAAAEPARRSVFTGQLASASFVLFVIVAAARFRSLAAVFSLAPDQRKD